MGEPRARDVHRTMQRDSWTEEIGPLGNLNISFTNGESVDRDRPNSLQVWSYPADSLVIERSRDSRDRPMTLEGSLVTERSRNQLINFEDSLAIERSRDRPITLEGSLATERSRVSRDQLINLEDSLAIERSRDQLINFEDSLAIERSRVSHDRPMNHEDSPVTERPLDSCYRPKKQNERDSPSGNGESFNRDSPLGQQEGIYLGDSGHFGIERSSEYPGQLLKPTERDSRAALAIGDPSGFVKGEMFSVRGAHERRRAPAQDCALRYEGDGPSSERGVTGYDRLSVERAHTMKDFEKQITELKKENFNLKLRIYFLEEQVQRRCDNSSEELHRMNIELRVEVESLKHEYQEKQNLLVRASKAMESLAGEHNFNIQHLKDDHLKQLQDLQEAKQRRSQELEEEIKQEKAELGKICSLLDQERMQRFNTEERLLAVKEQYSKTVGVLEERDWIIQRLNETLRSKDALIAQLEKQIGAGANSPVGSRSPGPTCRDCLATKGSEGDAEYAREWQRKAKEMADVVKELQQKLEERKAGVVGEERNSLKRDKAIQGLTLALKKKTKENEKLLKERENADAALAEAREAGRRDRSDGDPDYKKLILTIQAQQDLRSRLHDYERESGNLQRELDAVVLLREWLEKDIQSNLELRKILEAQMVAKYRESDTMSFLGDQTSYMSICLDHLGENNHRVDGGTETNRRSVETQTVLDNSPPTEERGHSPRGVTSERSVIVKDTTGGCPAFSSTTSSSSQTELKCFADKAILTDVIASEKESSGSSEPRGPRFMSDDGGSDKRQKCISNNLTKSRIPVLLKSSAGKRLRAESCLPARENERACLEKELQEENVRLLEQLKSAKLEIRDLQSNREKPEGFTPSLDESSGRMLHGGQQNGGLSVLVKVEKLQPVGEPGIQIACPSDSEIRGKETYDSLQLKEIQLGNERLSEKVKSPHVDRERRDPSSREIASESTSTKSVLDIENLVERDLPEQSQHKELQLENLRLAEQLKCAQMDVEKLQAREVNSESKKAPPDLESAYTLERDLAVRSLIEELQLENQRLLEQLKSAQVEIEKLREDKVLEDMDSSFRLDHMDAEDGDSERSFLDKTITNAVSVREVNGGNPDFEVQVSGHNFTCQNISGLCCHHDRFCVECTNDQETLIFQASSFKKVSTIQKECKLLTVSNSQRAFEDTSLSKYDLLVQSQARELSHQRQKIKESHNLSVVCSKNFINVIKAFDDLLSASSCDSNIALGFQEQLAQTVEWLKELEYKLSDAYYGEDDANSDHSADSLLYTPSRLVPGHKMWANKHGCHVLGLVEDYNALRKQILEAKSVLEETEAFLERGAQTAVLNMTEHFGNVFFEKLNRTKQSLEEASCLLKLLWRVSLPPQTHSSHSVRQVEETNHEMTRLRKRVLEQEKLLSGMVKRVYSESQVKDDIEKLILNQLAMTHEILKRAKGNLEVQVVDKH